MINKNGLVIINELSNNINSPYNEMVKYTIPTIRKYADKINVDFICLDNFKKYKHACEMKFYIKEMFEKYDNILYLDTDVMVLDTAPNIFDIIDIEDVGISIFEEASFHNPPSLRDFKKYVNQYNMVRKKYNKEVIDISKYNNLYYNNGIFLINKKFSFLLNEPIGERSEWVYNNAFLPEQNEINYNIVLNNIDVYNLPKEFSCMQSKNIYNPLRDEINFNSYFLHYAGAAGSSFNRTKLIEKDFNNFKKNGLV